MYKIKKVEKEEDVLHCDLCGEEIKKGWIGYAENFIEIKREHRGTKETHWHMHELCLSRLMEKQNKN